jgi:RNA-directed DNA polymerase
VSVLINLDAYFNVDALTEAYHRYKDSKTDRYHPEIVRIPTGADGITWQNFERGLKYRVEAISRLVLGGTYLFFPMREVGIEKPNGGVRILSVASVRDALVHRQLYEALYDEAETIFRGPGFNKVSFAYRRGKSAPLAAQRIWQSIRSGYNYAYEADIRSFFDTLSHGRLMSLIDAWLGRDTIARTLLWRYIRTDRVPYNSYPHGAGLERYFMTRKPRRVPRVAGVPQGGALSGLLANLYLHEFDRWVVEDLASRFDVRYYRYADDFVILTRDRKTSEALHGPVRTKLDQHLRLEIHPPSEKTGVRDLSNEGLNFVGFHFTDRYVRVRETNIRRFRESLLESLKSEPDLKSNSGGWMEHLQLAVQYRVNPKITGPDPRRCEECGLPVERRRSWIAFFAPPLTGVGQIKELDRWMRKQVYKYFRDRYRVRLDRKHLRSAGMKSLASEYYRVRQGPAGLCTCDQTSHPDVRKTTLSDADPGEPV